MKRLFNLGAFRVNLRHLDFFIPKEKGEEHQWRGRESANNPSFTVCQTIPGPVQ